MLCPTVECGWDAATDPEHIASPLSAGPERPVCFTYARADYTIGQWRAALYRVCRRAGLREIGWHALRHTFASHLVMRGEPLKVVSELLGHSTVTMTNRYAHLAPGATRAALAKLDEPAPSWNCSTVAADDVTA